MKKLNARDYQRLASIQTDTMQDLCNIYHVTLVSGTYSTQIRESTVLVSGVVCGFHLTNGSVFIRGQALTVEYDAVLRITASQPIGLNDTFELVERGNFQISGSFKPFSMPVVNSSVQHVQLKRIVT